MKTKSIVTYRKLARIVLLAALSFCTIAAHAQSSAQPATVTMSELAGSWTAAIVGNTGCAFTSMYVTFTLNSVGTGTANISANSASSNPGCGPGVNDGQTFAINTLNSNGAGRLI